MAKGLDYDAIRLYNGHLYREAHEPQYLSGPDYDSRDEEGYDWADEVEPEPKDMLPHSLADVSGNISKPVYQYTVEQVVLAVRAAQLVRQLRDEMQKQKRSAPNIAGRQRDAKKTMSRLKAVVGNDDAAMQLYKAVSDILMA